MEMHFNSSVNWFHCETLNQTTGSILLSFSYGRIFCFAAVSFDFYGQKIGNFEAIQKREQCSTPAEGGGRRDMTPPPF